MNRFIREMLAVAMLACLLGPAGCMPETYRNGFFSGPEQQVEEEGISTVDHWWIEDACGEAHAAYIEDGVYYLSSTTDPFDGWGSPVEVMDWAYKVDIFADKGTSCNIHFDMQRDNPGVGDPGPLTYARWDGEAIVDVTEVAAVVYSPEMVLDDADQPHFLWSFFEAMHRARNHSGEWEAITYLSEEMSGNAGWEPRAGLDGAGVWRGIFQTANQPPLASVQLWGVSSYDYGLSWQDTGKLFEDWQDSGWYTAEAEIFSTIRVDNMVTLFRSNREEEILDEEWDFWYMESLGGGIWLEPERYRPVDEDTRVLIVDGAVQPGTGEHVIVASYDREHPTQFYYQFRCIGGASFPAEPWPLNAESDVIEEVKVLWRTGDKPRLFWRLLDSTSWYTTSRLPPDCF